MRCPKMKCLSSITFNLDWFSHEVNLCCFKRYICFEQPKHSWWINYTPNLFVRPSKCNYIQMYMYSYSKQCILFTQTCGDNWNLNGANQNLNGFSIARWVFGRSNSRLPFYMLVFYMWVNKYEPFVIYMYVKIIVYISPSIQAVYGLWYFDG